MEKAPEKSLARRALSAMRRTLKGAPDAAQPSQPAGEQLIETMLTDEVLVCVFEHLSAKDVLYSAACVNKRW